eukprot:2687255-Rhodomonas_salina.2
MVRDTESNEVQPASAPATLGGDANGASESEKKHKELEEEENEQEEDPEDEIDDEDEDDLAERFTELLSNTLQPPFSLSRSKAFCHHIQHFRNLKWSRRAR